MSAAGGLQARVAADLDGFAFVPVGPDRALVSVGGTPRCWWEQHGERRRLLRLETSRFVLDGPCTDAQGRLRLQHTGSVRRTGLRLRVEGPDRHRAQEIGDRLLADGELARASLPLDFTAFTVSPGGGRWRVAIELMGGSFVRTTLPPSSSYVRLAADQVAALMATVGVLHRRLPVDPDTFDLDRPGPDPTLGRDRRTATDHHLPRRMA
ncbi:DUF3156 family protein [Egicoccus halophilus]|uniref:Uncharacterized protein n=1 Tax=Egicoccus halophilus TaxID=1670830 RepID=A0A8J3EW17_9ACTN|nr:DUF3156 family protein [Egicoccus halophilus]GGI09335.1 hypothetical protein GCM10011354_33570 [Egicoccus halophilus]